MTTDERIATFEARVAVLEVALDFERRERAALLEIVLRPLSENREGLSLLERNLELSMKHMVERISEAVASADGDRRVVLEAVHAEMAGMVSLILEAAEKQTLTVIRMQHQAALEGTRVLVDRIIALEGCLRLLERYLNVKFVPEAA